MMKFVGLWGEALSGASRKPGHAEEKGVRELCAFKDEQDMALPVIQHTRIKKRKLTQ